MRSIAPAIGIHPYLFLSYICTLKMNQNNMNTSYSFISDIEPTDEQLEELMEAVLKDVKERAAKADEKFKALQAQQIKTTLLEWQLKQERHGGK